MAASTGMDEAQLQHLVLVLGHITSEVVIDWAEVAKLRGISRKDNASTAFKSMMKKHGIEYANNKFTFINKDGAATAAAESKAKTATPRKRKPKATEENGTEDQKESPSPTKKQKSKKAAEVKEVEIKVDQDADDEEEEA